MDNSVDFVSGLLLSLSGKAIVGFIRGHAFVMVAVRIKICVKYVH